MALEKFAADQRSQLTASAIQHENVTNEEKGNAVRPSDLGQFNQ